MKMKRQNCHFFIVIIAIQNHRIRESRWDERWTYDNGADVPDRPSRWLWVCSSRRLISRPAREQKHKPVRRRQSHCPESACPLQVLVRLRRCNAGSCNVRVRYCQFLQFVVNLYLIYTINMFEEKKNFCIRLIRILFVSFRIACFTILYIVRQSIYT